MNVVLPMGASILDTKVSFEATTFLITWAAVAALVVIVTHLHLRVQRLERASATVAGTTPYGRLVGRRLDDLVGGAAFALRPRLVVALSGACKSCERVLSEIASPRWEIPTVVLWTDRLPTILPALPSNTIVPADGPALAAKLGIVVTPFALWLSQDGEIVKASPVNSVRSADASVDHAVRFHPAI